MTMANSSLTTLPPTMSSREIAELTGKRHDNVVRDIEKMLAENEIDRLKFEGVYLDAKGEQRKCHNLPKDLTITLVAGYRSDLRLKIVRRWMELEAANQPASPAIPQTYAAALLEAGRLAMEVDRQAKELAIIAPKAIALDRIAETTGRTNLREVGKALGIGSKRGIEAMRENKWIFRAQNGKWHAYSSKIDEGLVDVKYITYTNTAGEEVSTQQVFVTPKGMVKLASGLSRN